MNRWPRHVLCIQYLPQCSEILQSLMTRSAYWEKVQHFQRGTQEFRTNTAFAWLCSCTEFLKGSSAWKTRVFSALWNLRWRYGLEEVTFLLRGSICILCRRKSQNFNCWPTQVQVCGSGTRTGVLLLGDLHQDVNTEQWELRHDPQGTLQNCACCGNLRCQSATNSSPEWSFSGPFQFLKIF